MGSSPSRLVEFVSCAWALGRTPIDRLAILWKLSKNLRVHLGVSQYHCDAVYRLATRYGPVFLRDNFGDVTNLPDLLHRSIYRVSRLKVEGVVLDVGANIGLFALWVTYHNPGRAIYCFEPLPSNVKMVRLNCPTAIVSEIGLGRTRQTATLRVDAHQLMASSIETAWPTVPRQFEIHALDEFARLNRIDRIAFMKIDTEGMEVEVLDGAREALRRTWTVAMETHGPKLHRDSLVRLRDAGLTVTGEEHTTKGGLIFASRGV